MVTALEVARAPYTADLRAAYNGRSVFVTGHTGFKGSWLSLWLAHLGARVTGYALDPPTTPSNFSASHVNDVLVADHRADIRDRAAVEAAIRASNADTIFHLGARTVVLDSYTEPAETFSVNVTGTSVLLDAIRAIDRSFAVVIVTSDKCYANDESGRPFTEDDPLGGHDPYSASKAAQELVAGAYRSSFFRPSDFDRHRVGIATARAGNVIAGGDWTPHGIVADVFRALEASRPVALRRPNAIRPWQHVLEPLHGYLTLGAHLGTAEAAKYCGPWNFGPQLGDEATVQELTEQIIAAWGGGGWNVERHPADIGERRILRISIDRASRGLGWHPRWRLATAVERTVSWYRQFADRSTSARDACLADIEAYAASPEEGARSGGPNSDSPVAKA